VEANPTSSTVFQPKATWLKLFSASVYVTWHLASVYKRMYKPTAKPETLSAGCCDCKTQLQNRCLCTHYINPNWCRVHIILQIKDSTMWCQIIKLNTFIETKSNWVFYNLNIVEVW
jgi:hypothetical protein